jgi:peptide/nickel transport system substrate-binding protein
VQREENTWTRRRLGRRQVIRVGGLGMAGLAGAALIGCGSESEPGATPVAAAPQQSGAATTAGANGGAAFARSGMLNLRDGNLQTQDFHRHSGTMPTPSLVCDTPTAIAGDGSTQLFLLENLEAPDAATFTFKFRPNVRFHNGRTMTSEDVKQNLERIAGTDGAWLRSAAARIDHIETPDDQTISFTLSSPYSPLLSLFSELWLMAPESPGWDGTISTPIGTGPFMWTQQIPGDRIRMEAFPDYWQAERPRIAEINLREVEGDPTPALLAGDIHLAGLTITQRELAERDRNIDVQLEKSTSWQCLSFNNRSPRAPFDDVRLRRAIGHALDKDELTEFAAGPTGHVNNQMAPVGSFYWSDQLDDPFRTPDLAEANKLISAMGLSTPIRATMPVNTNPAQSEVVAAQLRRIGVECDLQVADDITTETRLQRYDWDLYYPGSGPRPDIALRFVRMMSDGPNPGLWGGPQDPEYDRLVNEAWALVDGEARKQKYLEAFQIVMDKLWFIVTYHRAGSTGIRREVQGWETGAVANFNRIDGGVSHITLT